MLEEFLVEFLDHQDCHMIIKNVIYKLTYLTEAARKKYSAEELETLENNTYNINNRVLDDQERLNYEIQNIIDYLRKNSDIDSDFIKISKECLNKIKELIKKESLSEAKQFVIIIQLILGFKVGFWSVFIDLARVVDNITLVKKKSGDKYE